MELRNSKTTYLGKVEGRKRFALDCFLGAVQFRESEGRWQDIDPSIEQPDSEGFSVQFTRLPYLPRIGEDSRRRIYPDRSNPDCWIEFKKPFQNMGVPQRQAGWFYWNFAHAVMAVRFNNTCVKFAFRLKDKQAPASITIPFETEGLTRQGRFLYHAGQIVGELRRPIATGSNLVEKPCEVDFSPGEVRISLDPTGLKYPIEIDPTLDLQVGAGFDDATTYATTIKNADAYNYVDFGSIDVQGYHRFTGLAAASGKTISEAYIELCSYANYTGVSSIRVWCIDADNTANFDTTQGELDGRAVTTNKYDWSPGNWVQGTWYSSGAGNLISVFQEMSDAGNLASGVAAVKTQNQAQTIDRRARSQEFAGNSHGAKFHLEYTETTVSPVVRSGR